MRIVDMAFGAQEGTEYSFDFYFQAIIAGNYMIRDVLSREVLEIDYLDQSRYNAKVTISHRMSPCSLCNQICGGSATNTAIPFVTLKHAEITRHFYQCNIHVYFIVLNPSLRPPVFTPHIQAISY